MPCIRARSIAGRGGCRPGRDQAWTSNRYGRILRARLSAGGTQTVPVTGGISLCAGLQQNILEGLLEQKLKERAINIHWNHRLADLTMKNGTATATIDELALEGKGYGVPDFEMR